MKCRCIESSLQKIQANEPSNSTSKGLLEEHGWKLGNAQNILLSEVLKRKVVSNVANVSWVHLVLFYFTRQSAGLHFPSWRHHTWPGSRHRYIIQRASSRKTRYFLFVFVKIHLGITPPTAIFFSLKLGNYASKHTWLIFLDFRENARGNYASNCTPLFSCIWELRLQTQLIFFIWTSSVLVLGVHQGDSDPNSHSTRGNTVKWRTSEIVPASTACLSWSSSSRSRHQAKIQGSRCRSLSPILYTSGANQTSLI